MRVSYYNAEKSADKKLRYTRRLEEIKMIEETIRSLIEDPLKNGLTDEQMFYITYYGLNEQELLQKNYKELNLKQIKNIKSDKQEDQLENDRYNALIDLYSTLETFDKRKINRYNDRFHEDIQDWNDYTDGFKNDTLIVKKMRNLQMLNKMAHKYKFLFKSILYRKNLQMNNYTEYEKKKLENDIEQMITGIERDAENAKQNLTEQFGEQKINELENDNVIKYCLKSGRWMFKQKDEYLIKIIEELQNSKDKYNYGFLDDAIVFDVPEYGQFSIHTGKKNTETIEALQELYNLEEYKGEYLGNVYILSKADPNLLKNVNYEELSDLDKKRYKIACGKEKTINKDKINDLQSLIDGAEDKEKANEIIKVIKEAGLDPEKVVTRTLLEKGQPDTVKDIIEIISPENYGIGLDILTRCKTLLSVTQNKAIDVMEMVDKINKLGIDSNIISEYPNFLTVSKSEKLEPIYDVLKQYKIDLTNHNIAVAFEGTPQNIKKNMDLAIENGLYDLAKVGVTKFFTSNNKNLNMRLNLLKENNTPLVEEKNSKRKINMTIFKREQDLVEMYGIDKEQILDELAKVKGQELIKDNKYFIQDDKEDVVLNDKQQEISNSIYEKLNKNQLEQDLVIKIGDYFYSAIKVKEQINNIIASLDIQDLEKEDINEILKIALFKNKNIDQKEINEVSEQIQNFDKEELSGEKETKQVNDFENDELPSEKEIEQVQNSESEELPYDKKLEYEKIRKMTDNISIKQQNVEGIEQIIDKLKETRKTLKYQIDEMEDKINNSIMENQETTTDIIQDIKKMREIVKLQKEKRKEVKRMIKRYKENRKEMKYSLKQDKNVRNSAIDDMEL